MKRSLWIFGLAMGVTLVTYFFIREGFIVFGVLHLIGVSLLLAYPFLRLNGANFVFGLLFILGGLSLQSLSVDSPWLLWLGLAPAGFYSVDYFPLLPWFGVILIGVAFGDLFYRGYRRRFPLPDLSRIVSGERTRIPGAKFAGHISRSSAGANRANVSGRCLAALEVDLDITLREEAIGQAGSRV